MIRWPLTMTIYIANENEFSSIFAPVADNGSSNHGGISGASAFMPNPKDFNSLTEFKLFTEFSFLFSMKSLICCVNTSAT